MSNPTPAKIDFEAVKAIYDNLQAAKKRRDEVSAALDKVDVERAGLVERMQEIYGQNWEAGYQADLEYLRKLQASLVQEG